MLLLLLLLLPLLPGHATEAVYFLNLVAKTLLVFIGKETGRKWVSASGIVVHLWCCLIEARFLFNSSKSAPAALLLTGPLLQLVVLTLKQYVKTAPSPRLHERLRRVLWVPMSACACAMHASAHPGMRRWLPSSSSSSSSSSNLSQLQLDACGRRIKAALQQQVRRATGA
jgi:hypothetical protein